MNIYGQVLGSPELRAIMSRISRFDMGPIEKAMMTCGYRIHREAITTISRGPARTGAVYKRGRKTHQASAAGQPPKTDTGTLVNSIYVKLETSQRAGTMVSVGTDLLYGKYLELGTNRLGGARPWLFPAFMKTREANKKTLAEAVEKSLADEAKKRGGT